MRSSFQRGWAAFLLVLMMAVASSAKPLYFNWMVPLTPCEEAIRIWLLQNWPQLLYPLLTMQWHGIGKDTLPQGPIATDYSWPWNQERWETILVCHLLQHRGKQAPLSHFRLYAKADRRWPWCRQAYLAIMRVKALTLWSLPHFVWLHGGLGEGKMTPSCHLWQLRELAAQSPEWENWLCPSHVQHTGETPTHQGTH